MVFPAPVGPTIAQDSPGSTTRFSPRISGLSGTYWNATSSNTTRPSTWPGRTGSSGSGISSSASRNSKTRSAEATPDCIRLTTAAIWVIGIWNCRAYWMNAWTSPRGIAPEATCRPPITEMST